MIGSLVICSLVDSFMGPVVDLFVDCSAGWFVRLLVVCSSVGCLIGSLISTFVG